MIISISSVENSDLVKSAIQEEEINTLNFIMDDKFSLNSYIKTQLQQLQPATIFLLDLSSLIDEEKDILMAINNIRMVNSKIRLIIIAPDRKEGDNTLSEIFDLGIYDIVVFNTEDRDDYLIKKELKKSLKVGKAFNESMRFKVVDKSSNQEVAVKDTKQSRQVIEKTIVKKEIMPTVNKALIGFAGTTERIGVTNNAIVSANYLRDQGYHVALVENSLNMRKCFSFIQHFFDELEFESDEFFTLNKVDYYKDFPMDELPKIILKNYNFIIIDFGDYSKEILSEFRRCVVQVILSGSKGWEYGKLNKVFESTQEDELKEYNYLFNFTHLRDKDDIRENMGELKKVYFSGYSPDPFNPDYYPDLDKIFKEYLNKTEIEEPKKPLIKGMMESIDIFKYFKKAKKET